MVQQQKRNSVSVRVNRYYILVFSVFGFMFSFSRLQFRNTKYNKSIQNTQNSVTVHKRQNYWKSQSADLIDEFNFNNLIFVIFCSCKNWKAKLEIAELKFRNLRCFFCILV